MPYRKTVLRAGEYYHLYNRGNNRQLIFLEQDNYIFFLQRLKEYTRKMEVDVIAYCLMPTHYHLLVRPSLNNLSEMMRSLLISYSKAMNKRYNRVGTLFQGGFKTAHINRDENLLHLSRYIHLNPVKAGLVKLPEDWQYSSYLEFIEKRQGTLPKPDIILRQFSLIDEYRAFVESGIKVDDKTIDHLVLEN
jgi:putative transposase